MIPKQQNNENPQSPNDPTSINHKKKINPPAAAAFEIRVRRENKLESFRFPRPEKTSVLIPPTGFKTITQIGGQEKAIRMFEYPTFNATSLSPENLLLLWLTCWKRQMRGN